MANAQVAHIARQTASADDDLPRTFRREREAREREDREAREREAAARGPDLAGPAGAPAFDPHSQSQYEACLMAPTTYSGGVVTGFDVPFLRLMKFLIKVVLAGIPALVLLAAMLFIVGKAIKTYDPHLLHLQILIPLPG